MDDIIKTDTTSGFLTFYITASKFENLPVVAQNVIETLSSEDLDALCSSLHGGRISAGLRRQPLLYKRLLKDLPDLEHIDGVWDMVDHTNKVFIESKSHSYNHNTPPSQSYSKYKKEVPDGYRMLFVITNPNYKMYPSGNFWPTDAYKAAGIDVINQDKLDMWIKANITK